MKPAYYNEFDPQAAMWLRLLITNRLIAAGDVDERSIEDVAPDDLRGYGQCHFFAGVGGWSYALRLAGWPDDRPVWTGSCPCQPFSAAGKGGGFADERHLWPAFHWLIEQCRPPTVFGEQVASRDGLAWLDLVQDDLEGAGYAVGSADLCAAGIGAPHIRQRLFWVGHRNDTRLEGRGGVLERADQRAAGAAGLAGGLADAECGGLQGRNESERESGTTGQNRCAGGLADGTQHGRREERADAGRRRTGDSAQGLRSGLDSGGDPCGLADAADGDGGCGERRTQAGARQEVERRIGPAGGGIGHESGPASPLHGFWRNADWLLCRDGKWRPVESGSFPLAHGLPARVVRLRGYGNAIVPQVAAAFIRAAT